MATPFAAYYDAVVPWEKRLAREMPLLEELARRAAGRVLVPACGTGGHVVALAQRGLDVLGFDIDEEAIALAQHKIDQSATSIAASGGKAELKVLDMSRAGELGPSFSCAFVLGNALPGISEPGKLLAALRGVAGALRPGGLFLTQNLNYDLRWQEKTQFFPVLSGETQDEEVLLVKFADYAPEHINFHALFLARPKSGGAWQSHLRSSRQLPLFHDRLMKLLSEAGFGRLDCWGDYTKTPFDIPKSGDLLVQARRYT